MFVLGIWCSHCYTFFPAGDQEQRRGRPGTENGALFCAPMSSGNAFWPPQPCVLPTGGRTLLPLRRVQPPSIAPCRAAPARRRRRARPSRKGGAGSGAPPVAAVLPSEPRPLPPRAAALLAAGGSTLRPRPSKRIPAGAHGPRDVSCPPCPRPPGAEEGARRGLALRRAGVARRSVPRCGSAPAARPLRGRVCARWGALGLKQGCGQRAKRLPRAHGCSHAAAAAAAPPERGAGPGRR